VNPWFVFVGMAAVTFATRFAMMPLMSRELPKAAMAWLQLVPVAILYALIAPAVFVPGNAAALAPRVAAAAVGVLVAWRTRSVIWTILAGMACYWLLMRF
jgi:branched-subunit amino acid transport protein